MSLIFYPFALLLLYFSYKSLRGGIDYLNYFKQELAKPPSNFTPFATIIAPCKGLDENLADNLNALFTQDYPSYEVVFVVDDRDDPAVAVIEEVSRHAAKAAKVVVAPPAGNSSQKVENLREAVLHVDERSEVFAFVDSDVKAGENWLRSLAAPLEDERIGASTGYRWFVSEHTDLAAELRSAWNASIASQMGPNTNSNFCWGGSNAIRRDLFERLEMREKWSGTLSDDLAVTRAMNAAGLPIVFVPQAVLPSAGTCTWRELFEFTNRQMKITRVYAPRYWLLSFFGSGLFNSVMIASLALAFTVPPGSLLWMAAVITFVIVSLLSTGKAWLRWKAIRLVLPGQKLSLAKQFPFQITLWLLTPPIFFINCLTALLSRRIRWRGTEYLMVSPEKTEVL